MVGEKFAALIRVSENPVIALYGDLGAGKTSFVKGMARGLGITSVVNSPTFSIINCYYGSINLFHMDAYRLKKPEDVLTIGFEDYVGNGICVIEWPERIEPLLPKKTIRMKFSVESETTRKIIMEQS